MRTLRIALRSILVLSWLISLPELRGDIWTGILPYPLTLTLCRPTTEVNICPCLLLSMLIPPLVPFFLHPIPAPNAVTHLNTVCKRTYGRFESLITSMDSLQPTALPYPQASASFLPLMHASLCAAPSQMASSSTFRQSLVIYSPASLLHFSKFSPRRPIPMQ